MSSPLKKGTSTLIWQIESIRVSVLGVGGSRSGLFVCVSVARRGEVALLSTSSSFSPLKFQKFKMVDLRLVTIKIRNG